jgi:cell surface protein SprA
MEIKADLKYTKDHEWISIDGDSATIGITDYAQGELGDIVYVEIESLGEQLDKEEIFGSVEAVKTVSDLFLPGYIETLGFLGTSKPSMGFVFGSQSDIRFEAAKNGWLTNFPSFNEQFTQVHNTKFDVSAEISWIDDLKISLKANRKYSENYSENFIIIDNEYNALSPNSFGNFEISTILISTSFSQSDENSSETFDSFQNNRLVIAQRLAQ